MKKIVKTSLITALIFLSYIVFFSTVSAQTALPDACNTPDVDDDNDRLIEICYLEDLNAIRMTNRSASGCPSNGCVGYELVRDLDFNDSASYSSATNRTRWTTRAGWQPIGNSRNPFRERFDGNGYTISGLMIKRRGSNYIGLFGRTRGRAEITRIGLLNVRIRGNNSVGGLVGENEGSIANSYATGSVSGNEDVGGLVGENEGSIANSYATSSVSGSEDIGGLVGYSEGTITNSYATGSVSGSEDVGGLVGSNEGTITNSYWDINTSGITRGGRNQGKTTMELQSPTAATGIYRRWSTEVWDFGTSNQYPVLKSRQSPALIGLSLSTGTLNPDFNRERFRYATTVDSDIERITLTPTANSARHRVTITANGNSTTKNLVPLNVGDNTIVISVGTRDNRATTRYILTVRRLEPCLTDLSLSSGSPNPTFGNPNQCSNASTRYTATVDSDIERITLTPTADSTRHRVTITANGNSITGNIVPLNVGDNTIVISVRTQDNKATTRYTLTVRRLEPCLTALSLSPGSPNPTFGNPNQCSNASTRYIATVDSDIERITLTPTANSTGHRVAITVNGNSITGDVVPLNVGNNNITIAVSTSDNKATTRYTLTVRRLEPCLTALSLSSGSLNPTFITCSDATINYRAIVANTIDQIEITATADSTAHTITYNSSRNSTVLLSVGNNTITVSLTTADGMATRDYNLFIRRLSTATLTGLIVEADSQMLELNPDFSLDNLDYYVNVENTMTTVTMTPTALTGRTIRVRYTPDDGTAINQVVVSGDSVTIMPLFSGANNVYIDVTHNNATERYGLTVIIGVLLRIKLFLEGPLQ